MTEIDSILNALNPYTICLVCLKSFLSIDGSVICSNCKEKGFLEE